MRIRSSRSSWFSKNWNAYSGTRSKSEVAELGLMKIIYVSMPRNRASSTTLSSSTSVSISKAISFLRKSLRSHNRALQRGPPGPVIQLWMTSRTNLLKRSSNWANKALCRLTTNNKIAPRPLKPRNHQENHSLKRKMNTTLDVRKLRKRKTPLVKRQRRMMRMDLLRKKRRKWRKKQQRLFGKIVTLI